MFQFLILFCSTLLQREPHIRALISRIFDKWLREGTRPSQVGGDGAGAEQAEQWKTGRLGCLALKGQSLLSNTTGQAEGAVCAGVPLSLDPRSLYVIQ